MSQTVVLKVGMSCGGCVGAVKRVLGNLEGVETFDIDLEQKKVTVKGNVQPDVVLQTVAKSGKKTEFWPTEASPSSESEKPVEPVAAPSSEAAPSCEAGKPVEPVDAPSSEAEKPVEPVPTPSSGAGKPAEVAAAASSEAEKPLEPVVA